MAGESLDVIARTFHTENDAAHAEGETYAVADRALAETLRAIGFVSIEGWTDTPASPPPTISKLTPTTAPLGAAPFTLAVTGTGFVSGSVIVWDGSDLPTTIVSESEVMGGPVDLTVEGAIPVQVRAGGVLSTPVSFVVTAAGR